ncbi:hypothetical protein RRG08_038713 [Elysia crispata]|uniref:Uncharacterized protein n=1 Tax=Elysia crispata TaxID=231223 RepID=A0AAE0ZKN6_9GAST|nr:hypothetical protein RRG08_038713 [Elysia crispata]
MTSLEKRAPSDAEKRVSCNEPLESAREDGRLFGGGHQNPGLVGRINCHRVASGVPGPEREHLDELLGKGLNRCEARRCVIRGCVEDRDVCAMRQVVGDSGAPCAPRLGESRRQEAASKPCANCRVYGLGRGVFSRRASWALLWYFGSRWGSLLYLISHDTILL